MDIILQDLDPRETYLKWFSTNTQVRPNGRGLSEMPNISFKTEIISSAEGSVMVNYGETIIIAALKSEVAEPEVNDPEKGFLVVNFHFAAGARNDIKPGPPSEEVQSMTEKLSKIIKKHVIDLNSLCISPNTLSRVLYLDVVCLCDTGFAFEAALLASTMSLKKATLPIPILDEETGLVRTEIDGIIQSLDLLSWPCSFTFSSLNRKIIILEPDNQEKNACGKSKLNIIVDLFSGSIIEIEKENFSLDDDILFTQTEPVVKNAIEIIRSLLELK